MSYVDAHLHYLAVLGAQRNRSKLSRFHCWEFVAFQERKLSLHPSHREKKMLLIIYDHRMACIILCHTHTHTHWHQTGDLMLENFGGFSIEGYKLSCRR